MSWSTGNVVVHSGKPAWGVGKVVDVNAQDVTVFFVEGGKRVFGQPAAFLTDAPSESVNHPLLEQLTRAVIDGGVRFMPFSECARRFNDLFPDGFYDPAYLTAEPGLGERHYKVVASELAKQLLNRDTWAELARQGQFAEICHRLAQVESKTNLLHSFEKIKWHAALKNAAHQQLLAEALFNDLYGAGHREARFTELAKALRQPDGCAKWTVATYYGFLLQPEPRVFIKPEVTKFAAEACGWDLKYDSALNWNTLSRAEGLATYLFDELTRIGLKPRDMIDVQSFIWRVAPTADA